MHFRYSASSSIAILFLGLAPLGGCHSKHGATSSPAPPDASRPQLKDDTTLANERAAAIAAGEVTPTSAPVLASERPKLSAGPAALPPAPLPSSPSAIESDILMVNDSAVTVSDVLYVIRADIQKYRESQTKRGLVERLERLVRDTARREVGTLLLYDKAYRELQEQQKKALDLAVDHEVDRRVGSEFGGSQARLVKHLTDYGLTLDQYKMKGRRQILVSQYTRDLLLPKIQLRRDELIAYYRANTDRFSTPATRELLLIEMPFAHYLPEGVKWDGANERTRAAAKLAALRECRTAWEELKSTSFAEVARQRSHGLNTEKGGSWGQIGATLNAPYDKVSALIFDFSDGQFSEPFEGDSAWFVAGCGKIVAATSAPFTEVQEKVRDQLLDERFNRMASDYIIRLAEKATLSSLEAFVQAGVKRAVSPEFAKINVPEKTTGDKDSSE